MGAVTNEMRCNTVLFAVAAAVKLAASAAVQTSKSAAAAFCCSSVSVTSHPRQKGHRTGQFAEYYKMKKRSRRNPGSTSIEMDF